MLCLLDLVQIHIFGFVYDNYIVNEYFISSTSTESHTNGKIYKWYSTYLKAGQPSSQFLFNKVTANNGDFIEWFCGFTDAEGSFGIMKSQDKYFSFRFAINLHIDDTATLELIQAKLGVGKVYIRESLSSFIVKSTDDINIIIQIFTDYPLNTHKHLNFLAWKKALFIYNNSSKRSLELLQDVEKLKSEMNKSRLDFSTTSVRKDFRITPEWLLGFVEGEGCFFSDQNNRFLLIFYLGQYSKDLVLMQAIKDYLNSLPVIKDGSEIKMEGVVGGSLHDVVKLSETTLRKNSSHPFIQLRIHQTSYLDKVLIPFFDAMTWYTKKHLDYEYLKIILKIRNLGLHYLP